MTVVSRTMLSLQSPAADGKLVYKKQDLREEISKILGVIKEKKGGKRQPANITQQPTVGMIEKEEINLESVITKIEEKLRPIIRKIPDREKDVQDALENLFISLDYGFDREKVTFAFSSKSFRPDFTSDSFRIAIDVKLCKELEDEKRIIDEINADIPAYKTHYENLLFVVYDLGSIRDVTKFSKGLEEAHENVFVRVIKH
jgi:hypothetical protein